MISNVSKWSKIKDSWQDVIKVKKNNQENNTKPVKKAVCLFNP